MSEAFKIIAAPFTPFHDDGALHLDDILPLSNRLQEDDVDGAFICGTTGEGASLTTEERQSVAEKWCTLKPSDFELIVHVGHTSQQEAQHLAAHAESIGADAIAAIAPFFVKPRDVNTLVQFCKDIAGAAPTLPFYFYHMPSMSGVDVSMAAFLPLAQKCIPNFGGIKFTHENLMDYQRCLTASAGQHNIYFGRDEILLAGLSLGARGAVGSTMNFMAPLYRKLVEAFDKGDLEKARQLQSIAQEVIALGVSFGIGPAIWKRMMKWAGVDCGPSRLPLSNLTPEQYEAMCKALDAIKGSGFVSA